MTVQILTGDCRQLLRMLPDESVHCTVTSPPYFGLRDYGVDGQLGLEPTPAAFVAAMVDVFGEVRRVLRKDGTLWLNLGDSYAGSGKYSPDAPSNVNGSKQSTNMASAGLRLPIPCGLKPKDLIGIPWRVAFALQEDGWYLRQDIIWSKPNPMPESVRDRCTKAHEYIFLLTKSEHYYYDQEAIAEPITASTIDRLAQPTLAEQEGSWRVPGKTNGSMKAKGPRFGTPGGKAEIEYGSLVSGKEYVSNGRRNKRSVWEVATQPFTEAHFATFPPKLIKPCILAGCPNEGTVLDPFGGAGITGLVADRLQRNAILIELNPEYAAMARRRVEGDAPLFENVEVGAA